MSPMPRIEKDDVEKAGRPSADKFHEKVVLIEAALSRLNLLPVRASEISVFAHGIASIGRRPRKTNIDLFRPTGRTRLLKQLSALDSSLDKVRTEIDGLTSGAIDALGDLGLMRFDVVDAVVIARIRLQAVVDVVLDAQSALSSIGDPLGGNTPDQQATIFARYVACAYEQITGKHAPRSRPNHRGSRNILKDQSPAYAAYDRLMREMFDICRPGRSRSYKHPALEAAKWLHEQREVHTLGG